MCAVFCSFYREEENLWIFKRIQNDLWLFIVQFNQPVPAPKEHFFVRLPQLLSVIYFNFCDEEEDAKGRM
jgi:hypothetical protein